MLDGSAATGSIPSSTSTSAACAGLEPARGRRCAVPGGGARAPAAPREDPAAARRFLALAGGRRRRGARRSARGHRQRSRRHRAAGRRGRRPRRPGRSAAGRRPRDRRAGRDRRPVDAHAAQVDDGARAGRRLRRGRPGLRHRDQGHRLRRARGLDLVRTRPRHAASRSSRSAASRSSARRRSSPPARVGRGHLRPVLARRRSRGRASRRIRAPALDRRQSLTYNRSVRRSGNSTMRQRGHRVAGSLFRTKSIDCFWPTPVRPARARSSGRSGRGRWSRSASARSSAPGCSSAPRRRSPTAPARRSSLAFIVAGVGCAFAGLCYAEFASMIPVAGSAYTYSYATMGELRRLDHRLGPGARIRGRRRHGRDRVERVRQPGARVVRAADTVCMDALAVRGDRGDRRQRDHEHAGGLHPRRCCRRC